jgi:hypothetical protein
MVEKKQASYHQTPKFEKLIEEVYSYYKRAIGLSKRKVFCIGFNKTGTTSLHHFFKEIGLNSNHNDSWPNHSKAKKIDESLFRYRCYSDGEKSDFIALDSVFQNSLFVLNNRNERDWLYSRLKHIMRHNKANNLSNILSDKRFGWMARDFFFNEELAIRKWICERRIYIMQARQYFKDRVNFIEIDVTASKQWGIELLEFFEKNSFTVKRSALDEGKILYSNRRNADFIHDQLLLTKYKQLVDSILAEIDGT